MSVGDEMIKKVAETSIRNQVVRDGDFYDGDGLLVCAVCKERRQKYLVKGDLKIKVSTQCSCDRKKAEVEEDRKQKAESMQTVERLKKESLMDSRFMDASFGSCTLNDENRRQLSICKKYADKFDVMFEKNQGLLLYGEPGTGKTYAASCIANALLERQYPVLATSFTKILENIMKNPEAEERIMDGINRMKLIIFDDLGAERGTDYALEKVYNIIDERYRKKLPMILTTNLSLDDMKNEQDIRRRRIYDRVFENCYPLRFVGKSWRMVEANKRFGEMKKLLED